jgi:hypothetical protein
MVIRFSICLEFSDGGRITLSFDFPIDSVHGGSEIPFHDQTTFS